MKTKFARTLIIVVLIWLLAMIGFGIHRFTSVSVRKADQHAVEDLFISVSAYLDKNGKYPGATEEVSFDMDLQSDYILMKDLTGDRTARDLLDSEGNLFRLRFDTNNDDVIYSPIDNETLKNRVLIWSAGRDGKFETWRDNARSW